MLAWSPSICFGTWTKEAFRFNNPLPMSDGDRFSYLVRKVVGTCLTYAALTARLRNQRRERSPSSVAPLPRGPKKAAPFASGRDALDSAQLLFVLRSWRRISARETERTRSTNWVNASNCFMRTHADIAVSMTLTSLHPSACLGLMKSWIKRQVTSSALHSG